MTYDKFKKYLDQRAQKLSGKLSAHKNFMLEEDDEFEWKIATEMLESWLGIKEKSDQNR